MGVKKFDRSKLPNVQSYDRSSVHVFDDMDTETISCALADQRREKSRSTFHNECLRVAFAASGAMSVAGRQAEAERWFSEVRLWHFSDLPTPLTNVGYQVKSVTLTSPNRRD